MHEVPPASRHVSRGAPYAVQGGESIGEVQLTDEPHPFPALRDMQKDILQYERADGVGLHAELFTPPGYDKELDGRLPCLLWAYPRCVPTPLPSVLH
jgi:dipeptidyl aminopeptidase/acylaminoacyl peptidase